MELVDVLNEHQISATEYNLSCYELHAELSLQLSTLLKQNNLYPQNIVAAYNKFVLFDNQLINDLAQQLHLKQVSAQFQTLNFKDKLTNTYTKHAFIEELDRAIALCDRSTEALTILHSDFSEFANINQKYGFAACDRILQLFAKVCVDELRKTETIARDDDEFWILLPNTPICNARAVCERLVRKFEQACDIPVTVRIGVSSYSPRADSSLEEVLQQAETELEFAKERSIITDNHEFSLNTQGKSSNVLRLVK